MIAQFGLEASMWSKLDGDQSEVVLFHHQHMQLLTARGIQNSDRLKIRELVRAIFSGSEALKFSLRDIEQIMGLYSRQVIRSDAAPQLVGCIEELN